LHQGALLVLEQEDVALPDAIFGRPSRRRGRGRVLQDAASLIDRLEAGPGGGVMGVWPEEAAQTSDPVLGGGVREVRPEDVVEDRVIGLADRVHVRHQQRPLATQTARDVHIAGAIPVQPERKERKPRVVRRERGHPGPLEVGGQELVEPGVARRDLQVAMERAAAPLVGQGGAGPRGVTHKGSPCVNLCEAPPGSPGPEVVADWQAR